MIWVGICRHVPRHVYSTEISCPAEQLKSLVAQQSTEPSRSLSLPNVRKRRRRQRRNWGRDLPKGLTFWYRQL
jgi:hypothetical protein